ncbi:unnamed protein product [Triticum turgidum subsp. durum]|uniref:NB-ARC domain-containing protein n=1 Tax=Triticum turgidum subsp. durum TaxID=4567 RepID=A0A9R0Z002_TRITD|nr:unnamed protein product [Triticum turgidum subsp. durum]
METAIGAANWLVGKVLDKLSDDLVAAYLASTKLGHNSERVKFQLEHVKGLLQAAQERDVSRNPGLKSLLEQLSKKADEAEDALDELHYFLIQDHLDGTKEAMPEPGDGLRARALHSRHAARHTFGNWLSCFSCSPTQDDVSAAASVVTISNHHNATKSDCGNYDGGYVAKLKFNRVDMSKKITSVIEGIHDLCDPVSDLLNKIPNHTTSTTVKRPLTSSVAPPDRLYGRDATFEKTISALTGSRYQSETLSVMPFVGPGGIGKTTFTQHLSNDKRIEEHFIVRVWVCVSNDFDVLKLTQEVLSCICENGKKDETSNLDKLQKSIADELKSKRFLVVLDDIWSINSETEWKKLLAPFTKGETKGSMVLVTTRFPSIAQKVCTTDIVELDGLEPNDFLELFEASIFASHNKPGNYDDDLIDVAREIAKKLKGSPLAANTVGRLLRKHFNREYWIGVLEKDEWKNAKDKDDIMPSLKISYDYLPFHLKKCFSYFSLFCEDYEFTRLEMTQFWTAIGILDINDQETKNYFEELLENGFLKKVVNPYREFYVMHDLLHELSRNVSYQECANISSFPFSVADVPPSIRHLSINLQRKYDESFQEEMGKLKHMIDIANLRSLLIFELRDEIVANILKDTFEDLKAVRVLYVAMQNPKSLPHNFPNLLHLRYLKLSSCDDPEMDLPSTLSGFYHLKFLDLKDWDGSKKLPKHISRLVNLHFFHCNPYEELHSNIPEVGKMKYLHELKKFHVKKESTGFELRELGGLSELRGVLRLCNLEAVASKGEACAAELKNKKNLKELQLVWSTEHQTADDHVLDGLQPHPNLRVLCIINPGVAPCPRWLCGDISTKHLESLHLEGISWGTLPPFEHLPHLSNLVLSNIARMSVFGPLFNGITDKSFMNLKKIEFENMRELVEWVGEPNSHFFSRLESIGFRDCPLLSRFPFMECSERFTNLLSLVIVYCPKISQLPPMPHTSTLEEITVLNGQSIMWTELRYCEKFLCIEGYNGELAFHNMDKIESLSILDVSKISVLDLKKLNSLRSVHVSKYGSMFSPELDASVALHSVQELGLAELSITEVVLSMVFRCFPALSKLRIIKCEILELSASSVLSQESMGSGNTIKPFPSSIKELEIREVSGFKSMALLSNLTSLTSVWLQDCEELTMDGFNPLITVNLKKLYVFNQTSAKQKISIAGDLLSEVARSGLMQEGSFKLEELRVDSISGVLIAPICSHLTSTLRSLIFSHDMRAESFTEGQEQALQFLTSLEFLMFNECRDLKSLPRCNRLSSLTELRFSECAIQSLPPKEDLPASLESLYAMDCGPELKETMKKLQRTDPYFSTIVDV